MPLAHLSDRAIIRISGDDRISFLQSLITNDASKLTQGEAIYAALLSPQGKFLHDFILIPEAEHLLMDIHDSHADAIIARMSLYRLRAKVAFERIAMPVAACWEEGPLPADAGGHYIPDPRMAALGWRLYGPQPPATASLEAYHEQRIRLGVPEGALDMHVNQSLLLEFGFEALHGVSFSKGCYIGQEVTARSKFRGQVRRQLCPVVAPHPLPAIGTPVMREGEVVGELRSISGSHGLALLRMEALEQTAAGLMAGGVPLQIVAGDWMR